MSDVITVPGRTINTITAEILVLTQQAQASALASACQIGKRLVEAKALVDHGEWGDYLKNEVSYSQSTANNFMRLYRELGENPNSQALGNLSPTQALSLIALPEGEREEFVQNNDVSSMTTRELDKAVKEKKAAMEMLAVAQESANDLRQQLEDQKVETEQLRSSLAEANALKDAANKKSQEAKKSAEISESERDKLRAEGKSQAQAEYDAKIKEAQDRADAADDARMDMEKALVEAQRQIKELAAASQLSGTNAASFEVLFNQILDNENRMIGYLLKVEAADPEQGKKLRASVWRLGQKLIADAEKGAVA